MPKFMMATKAFHMLGEVSSKEADICLIHSETEEDYIGSWVTSMVCFVEIRFPKSTTRELTDIEKEIYRSRTYSNGHNTYKLDID